jgi:MoxR-like ATPase
MTTTATRKKVAIHPLADLIPDIRFAPVEEGGTYIGRVIHGVDDMELLEYAHKTNKPTLMFGDTGPGKTSMVMAYAASRGVPLVTVMCNGGVDPNSFWGQPVPDAEQGFRIQDADTLTVVENGGILYLDELNFLPAKHAAPFNSLLDGRRQITILEQGNRRIQAHKDLLVIATYNPDYEGTRPLNAALKNRFKLKLQIGYDRDVESELVCMPVMLNLADSLRARRAAGDIKTPVSTNMLIEFEQFCLDLDLDFAIENFAAAFSPDEREAVMDVFELNKHMLDIQVAKMQEDNA